MPKAFLPQVQSEPSFLMAAVQEPPTDTAVTSSIIFVGVLFIADVVPLPIWPWLFSPQVQSEPSFLMAAI